MTIKRSDANELSGASCVAAVCGALRAPPPPPHPTRTRAARRRLCFTRSLKGAES